MSSHLDCLLDVYLTKGFNNKRRVATPKPKASSLIKVCQSYSPSTRVPKEIVLPYGIPRRGNVNVVKILWKWCVGNCAQGNCKTVTNCVPIKPLRADASTKIERLCGTKLGVQWRIVSSRTQGHSALITYLFIGTPGYFGGRHIHSIPAYQNAVDAREPNERAYLMCSELKGWNNPIFWSRRKPCQFYAGHHKKPRYSEYARALVCSLSKTISHERCSTEALTNVEAPNKGWRTKVLTIFLLYRTLHNRRLMNIGGKTETVFTPSPMPSNQSVCVQAKCS